MIDGAGAIPSIRCCNVTGRTIPIGGVIAYDKFLRQIEEDPLMEPLRVWLSDYYKEPQRVSMGDSYYGWFFIFEKKDK